MRPSLMPRSDWKRGLRAPSKTMPSLITMSKAFMPTSRRGRDPLRPAGSDRSVVDCRLSTNGAGVGFVERYGPWACVAGASKGIGLALADEAAGRGLHVVMVARREEPLRRAAAQVA